MMFCAPRGGGGGGGGGSFVLQGRPLRNHQAFASMVMFWASVLTLTTPRQNVEEMWEGQKGKGGGVGGGGGGGGGGKKGFQPM